MLTVMRYIDLNPVRAGLAKTPKDWKFSSYRHYAFGEVDNLIDDAPDYLSLASSFPARRKAYVALFARKLSAFLFERQPFFSRRSFIGSEMWMAKMIETVAIVLSRPTLRI
jgi:putative transposase